MVKTQDCNFYEIMLGIISTQTISGKIICFIGFYLASVKFFKDRVKYEEQKLNDFFGEDYSEYKKKTSQFFPGWDNFLGIKDKN